MNRTKIVGKLAFLALLLTLTDSDAVQILFENASNRSANDISEISTIKGDLLDFGSILRNEVWWNDETYNLDTATLFTMKLNRTILQSVIAQRILLASDATIT